MDDLAEELGMSKKTLYAHFDSKTALVEGVIRDKLERADADLEEATSGHEDDFPARLQRLLACLRGRTEEIQAAFVRDVRREVPELFALVQAGRRAMIQRHFGKLLKEGRKAGAIRKDIPLELLIEILVGAVDAVVIPEKLEQLALIPQTAMLHVISVYLEGIMIGKGRARA